MMLTNRMPEVQRTLLREAAHRQAENELIFRNDTGRGTNLSIHTNYGAIDAIRIVAVTQLELMTAQQFTAVVDYMAADILAAHIKEESI
ncbi:MAG: hypothetical protein LC650_02395 [Actinobacteria bacterium]|nr:hypothetical protein [Actinomycetota bacterium]